MNCSDVFGILQVLRSKDEYLTSKRGCADRDEPIGCSHPSNSHVLGRLPFSKTVYWNSNSYNNVNSVFHLAKLLKLKYLLHTQTQTQSWKPLPIWWSKSQFFAFYPWKRYKHITVRVTIELTPASAALPLIWNHTGQVHNLMSDQRNREHLALL
jgi:hypothetical protein